MSNATPTPAPKPKGRWFRIGCFGILAFFLFMVLSPLFWRDPEYVSWPDTGFDFPEPDQISSIVMDALFPEGPLPAVEVPREHWPHILDALQPSQIEYFPKKWPVMGAMRIQTNTGETIYVQLYGLSPPMLGGFKAGEELSQGSYYRGGNSDQLEAAIRAALPSRELLPEDAQ